MTERTKPKLGAQKRPSKRYPKILAIPSAGIRYAQRILDEVRKGSSRRAK